MAMKLSKLSAIFIGLFFSTSLFAAAQVIDAYAQQSTNQVKPVIITDNTSTLSSDQQQSLPLAKRISQLEQAVSHMQTNSLVNRVNQLQQQVAQLRGQLEVQAHQRKMQQAQASAFQKQIIIQLSKLENNPNRAQSPRLNATVTADDYPSKASKHNLHGLQRMKDTDEQISKYSKKGAWLTHNSTKTNKIQERGTLPHHLSKKVETKPGTTANISTKIIKTSALTLSKPHHQTQSHQHKNHVSDYKAYEGAYYFIRKNQFKKAEIYFKRFIRDYPKSKFVSNAYYWMGELYLQGGRFEDAELAFQKVLTKYPNSNKAADALLKLGYVYYDTGKWQVARNTLDKVMALYPKTTPAKLAANRLRNMNQQGL